MRAGLVHAAPALLASSRSFFLLDEGCPACCRVLVHVAEGDLSSSQRGGDALYSFVRAAADWPGLLAPGQSFGVEVGRAQTPCTPSVCSRLHAKER